VKKKIFGAAFIAAMALVTGWNFNQSKNEVELSDLALVNADALTRSEIGDKCGGCSTSYSYFCCTHSLNGTTFILKKN